MSTALYWTQRDNMDTRQNREIPRGTGWFGIHEMLNVYVRLCPRICKTYEALGTGAVKTWHAWPGWMGRAQLATLFACQTSRQAWKIENIAKIVSPLATASHPCCPRRERAQIYTDMWQRTRCPKFASTLHLLWCYLYWTALIGIFIFYHLCIDLH